MRGDAGRCEEMRGDTGRCGEMRGAQKRRVQEPNRSSASLIWVGFTRNRIFTADRCGNGAAVGWRRRGHGAVVGMAGSRRAMGAVVGGGRRRGRWART